MSSVLCPGVCGRAEQQRLAEPRHRGHGAGPDGDPGHVEQGQLPQAAAALQQGPHRWLGLPLESGRETVTIMTGPRTEVWKQSIQLLNEL